MSEWLTYSLSDFLLFSPHTYYRLLELYNRAIWPGQVLALALGAAILALLLHDGGGWRGRAIAAILAAAWLWVAWAYLLARYDDINWAARYFTLGFAIEGLLLAGAALLPGRRRFRAGPDAAGRCGFGLFVFALVVQPLIGPFLGRGWSQAEVFAIAPDPTAVGTLGLLLTARGAASRALMVVPLAWCAISGATLWAMRSPDAFVTPAAAALALFLAARKTRAQA